VVEEPRDVSNQTVTAGAVLTISSVVEITRRIIGGNVRNGVKRSHAFGPPPGHRGCSPMIIFGSGRRLAAGSAMGPALVP
jgi:hypothetical protein